MTAQEPAGGAPSSPEEGETPEGVFGNLPRARPGARSPRRDAEQARQRPRAARAAEKPAAEETAASSEAAPADVEGDGGAGLEEVAWAGVAAAAEAATIGVRLANRALEAMRDAVERR